VSCSETLKKKGYRLTPQRLTVLEILHQTDGHISAPEIVDRVQARHPYVNKSTDYRTLQLLKELGLVTETKLDGDALYYHHAEKGHHHHLICEVCGRSFEVEEDIFASVEERLRDTYGFDVDLRHLALHGRCSKCRT